MIRRLHNYQFLIINWGLFLLLYILILISSYFYHDSQTLRTPSKISPNSVEWTDIFLHNLGLALIIIGAGIISFGVLSFFIVSINFYLLFISFTFAFNITSNFLYGFLIISTHGILEILAIGLAFYLSTFSLRKFIKSIYSHNKIKVEKLTTFVKLTVLMIGLFLLSSLIEAFITPYILNHL